jgi:hypothetical protein
LDVHVGWGFQAVVAEILAEAFTNLSIVSGAPVQRL